MTNPNVRSEVVELKMLGPLPSEARAEVIQLERIAKLYREITRPITNDEARVLIKLFGPDECYGLASLLMRLIETAPGWPLNDCFQLLDYELMIELRNHTIRSAHQP